MPSEFALRLGGDWERWTELIILCPQWYGFVNRPSPLRAGAQLTLDAFAVLITTPFHPGYLTAEVLSKAKNLKVSSPPHGAGPSPDPSGLTRAQICITAGVGSDHIDLNAANLRKITVAEVTGSNVVSCVPSHLALELLLTLLPSTALPSM